MEDYLDVGDISAEQVQEIVTRMKTLITSASFTPFFWIIKWMTLGKGYRKKDQGMPSIMWSDDLKTLYFRGIKLPISAFQETAIFLKNEAIRLLDPVLFGTLESSFSIIDLNRIYDSLLVEGPMKSFYTR